MKIAKTLAAAAGISLALCAAPTASALGSEDYMGSIGLTAASFCPRGTIEPTGQVLPINQYSALFSLLGTTFGGDGKTNFALPNLSGQAPDGIRFCLVTGGLYPAKD